MSVPQSQSENLEHLILQKIDKGIIFIDEEGKIGYWNKQAGLLLGYHEEEVLNRDIATISEQLTPDALTYQQLAQQVNPFTFRWNYTGKVGKPFGLEARVFPTEGDEFETSGWLIELSETTFKVEIQEQEKFLGEILSGLLEARTHYVMRTDAEGKILFVNEAFREKFSFLGPIIGEGSLKFIHEEDHLKTRQTIQKCFENPGQRFGVEIRKPYLNNEYFYTNYWEFVSIQDQETQIIGILGIGHDITHLKGVELALKRSENFLNKAMDIGEIGAWDWNIDTNQISFSDQMNHIFPYPLAARLDPLDGWLQYIHPHDASLIAKQISQALAGNNHEHEVEFRLILNNGEKPEIRYIYASGDKVVDEKTGENHIIGVVQDITRRKRIERQLVESLEFNKNIISHVQDGVIVLDKELRCQIWNHVLEEMTGIPSVRAIGKPIFEIWSQWKLLETEYRKTFQQVLDGNTIKQEAYLPPRSQGAKSGWVGERFSPNLNSEGEIIGIIGALTDLTDLKEKEKALEESSKSLQLATSASGIGIWKYTLASNKLEVNKEIMLMHGLPVDQKITYPELQALVHPEDKDRIVLFDDLLSGREVKDVEFRIIKPDGDINFVSTSSTPIFNSLGTLIQIVGVNIDITHLKVNEASLREKNEELIRTNKELDTYVYHTTHNLRAPIANVKGLIDLLEEEKDPATRNQLIEFSRSNVETLDVTISHILQYSYNNRMEIMRHEVNLHELIEVVIKELAYMDHHSHIQLQNLVEQDLRLYSDRERLKMISQNLLSNAIKYYDPQKVAPFVQISSVTKDDAVEIYFRDNGQGIDEAHQEKIFQMFFRALNEGQGSGLGLYIVQEAVRQLDGEISLESQTGVGSTFILKIPR
ncbi:MAG: PAS domain S-box protein [Bacteroidota bacterium]